jgi:hypothetical protein
MVKTIDGGRWHGITKIQGKYNDQRVSVNSILKPLKSLTCTGKMKKGSGEVQVEGRCGKKSRRNSSTRKDDCGVLTHPTFEL